MTDLIKLFRLMELTRAQSQYGYIVAEIPKAQLSDLAQHHYLVTFIAWQLGLMVQRAGATVDLTKVLEFGLIHDLGELFGGDISMSYAKANPAARAAAKAFEMENQKYLARLFGDGQAHFEALSNEIMAVSSLEGIIAKTADYIELTQYKLYVRHLTPGDVVMAVNKMNGLFEKVTDQKAKTVLKQFVEEWSTELNKTEITEIFESAKAE